MLQNILSLFQTEDPPARLNPADAQVAMAALLVRVARVDHDYAEAEVAWINKILTKRFDLDPAGVEALRTEAEELEAQAPDTVRFTRVIKDAVAYEDRIGVVQALWSVALADGDRDAHENAQMRVITELLGITDRESAQARQKAMQ